METVSNSPTRVTRQHFLRYANPKEAKSLPRAIIFLAWIVRVFVPHVAEIGGCPWECLRKQRPIPDYVTSSDIAFTVLVLEQHVVKWKKLAAHCREHGHDMGEELSRNVSGLLYPGGIAGAEAKRRFCSLHKYFQTLFFSPNCSKAQRNMANLQQEVNRLAPPEEASFNQVKQKHTQAVIENDVLHRVFYYMHM